MKRLRTVAILAFCLAARSTAHALPKDGLGIGIIVGEPTGLSLKKWIGHDQAIDAGIAWSFSENESLHLHADYLFHRFDLFSDPDVKGRIPLYFGLGARIKLKDDDNGKGKNEEDALVGVRVPLGISCLMANAPIDLFVEIVPILDIAPHADFGLNAAIGARFYFWH